MNNLLFEQITLDFCSFEVNSLAEILNQIICLVAGTNENEHKGKVYTTDSFHSYGAPAIGLQLLHAEHTGPKLG